MKSLLVTLALSLLFCSCKKDEAPRIDKTAIYGTWRLKSLNRTVEVREYPYYVNNYKPIHQIQTYKVNDEILDIKWHTDYLDNSGNIIRSSDAILDNFETLDKTQTEIHRIFTVNIEFSEGYLGHLEFVSKKTDGTIVHSGSSENNWSWGSYLGEDDIWLNWSWSIPRFISTRYIYDLHDDTFIIRAKVISGEPVLSDLHPTYQVDDNEVIFERVK